MLRIDIKNDGTGTDVAANYDYIVRVNYEVLETGRIEGFDRREGWRALLVYVCTPPQYRDALKPKAKR